MCYLTDLISAESLLFCRKFAVFLESSLTPASPSFSESNIMHCNAWSLATRGSISEVSSVTGMVLPTMPGKQLRFWGYSW